MLWARIQVRSVIWLEQANADNILFYKFDSGGKTAIDILDNVVHEKKCQDHANGEDQVEQDQEVDNGILTLHLVLKLLPAIKVIYLRVAAIAQWIRCAYQPSAPWLESQAYHLHFAVFNLNLNCNVKRTKINKKWIIWDNTNPIQTLQAMFHQNLQPTCYRAVALVVRGNWSLY